MHVTSYHLLHLLLSHPPLLRTSQSKCNLPLYAPTMQEVYLYPPLYILTGNLNVYIHYTNNVHCLYQ